MSDLIRQPQEQQPQGQAPPRELPAPIGQEEQEDLVRKLSYEYDQFQNSVGEIHARVDRYHELYEGDTAQEKEFPWPGASNYAVPLIMSTVDSMHARIVKAVFEVDPVFLARPRTPEGVSSAQKAQWYMDYWVDQMGLAKKLDLVSHSMLVEGVGIIKVDWDRVVRDIPRGPQNPQAGGLFTGPENPPTQVTEYEGPAVRQVPLKDFVIIPADAPTIDDAVYVGHRVFLTTQELRARQGAGIYFNVEELLDRSSGDSTAERTPQASRGLLASSDDSGKYEETNQYEVVEIYGPYDFGEGPTPALMTFSAQHDILLRVQPYPYHYGRPPYVDFSVYPRVNFFFARSLPEILESPQEELTTLHNMRADAIMRRIAPPLLRQMGSRWDPDEQPWRPGQIIDVNDPAEIIELQLSDIPNGVFAHEQDILAFSERVTGMSDYFMGRSPTQGRTATEVNRVTSEGLARMDVMITRFQQSMKKLAWMVWWLLYQYRPYWDYFYAENQAMAITKAEMRPAPNGMMPFEFIPQGQLSDASKEAIRQQNLILLQTAGGFLQQFYPDGLQYLLDKIFRDFDVQDRGRILGPSWNLLQQQLQQAMQAGYQQGVEDGAAQAQGEGE